MHVSGLIISGFVDYLQQSFQHATLRFYHREGTSGKLRNSSVRIYASALQRSETASIPPYTSSARASPMQSLVGELQLSKFQMQ